MEVHVSQTRTGDTTGRWEHEEAVQSAKVGLRLPVRQWIGLGFYLQTSGFGVPALPVPLCLMVAWRAAVVVREHSGIRWGERQPWCCQAVFTRDLIRLL